ncbi:kielin/chordin-like protein isoform X2 [Paramormyrops kingsleyae]
MENGLPAWRLHKNVQHLTLPQHDSINFQRKVTDSFGLYFSVQQKRRSSGTLISFTVPAFMNFAGQPLLQLISSRRSNLLELDYLAAFHMEPARIHFPINTAFLKGKWAHIALSLNRNRVVLFVNCEEAMVLEKDFEDLFSSMFLSDLEITLASTPRIYTSKFQGSLQTAWLSTTGYKTRPWHCPNTSDLNGILWPTEDSARPPEDVPHRQVPSRHLEPQSDQEPDLGIPQRALSQSFPHRKVICLWEGKDIEEGTWMPNGPDEVCLCHAGEFRCMPSGNDCVYEGTSYKNGDVFLSRSSPCTNCSCIDGLVKCIPVTCKFPHCLNPKRTPGSCCLPCSGCMVDGVMREEGSIWTVDQQSCRSCTCLHGEAQCHEVMCPQISCQKVCRGDDECANTCCYNGRSYKNEETFSDPKDHCKSCVCQTGKVICRAVACLDVRCSNPYTPPGECCPRCSECTFENAVYLDGHQFPNPRDPCQQCTCLRGEVTCEYHQYPQSHCNHPQRTSYCQDNRNDCYYAGEQYVNGMEFVHPTNKCKTCRCVNGHVQCLMTTRPPSQCSDPHLVPGECHPRCSDECLYVGRIYRHSEHFQDPQDRRRSCICSSGEVTCQDYRPPQNRCYPEVKTATGSGEEGENDDQRKLEPHPINCPEHQDRGDSQPRCGPQLVHQCPHTTQNPCPRQPPNPNPCIGDQPCEVQNPCPRQPPNPNPCTGDQPSEVQNPCPRHPPNPNPCTGDQPSEVQNPCPRLRPNPNPCTGDQPSEVQNPCPRHPPNPNPCTGDQPSEVQNPCPRHPPNPNPCTGDQPSEVQNPCPRHPPNPNPCTGDQPSEVQNPCPRHPPNPNPCTGDQPCEVQNPCPRHPPNPNPCTGDQPCEIQNPCPRHPPNPNPCTGDQPCEVQNPCPRQPPNPNPCIGDQPCEVQNPCPRQPPNPNPCTGDQPSEVQNPCPRHPPNPNPCTGDQPSEVQNPCPRLRPNPNPCTGDQPSEVQNPCPRHPPNPNPCTGDQPSEVQNPCPRHPPNPNPCTGDQPSEVKNPCPRLPPNPNPCTGDQPSEVQNPCPRHPPNPNPCTGDQPSEVQNPCPRHPPNPNPCTRDQPCEVQNPCPRHPPNPNPCTGDQPCEVQNIYPRHPPNPNPCTGDQPCEVRTHHRSLRLRKARRPAAANPFQLLPTTKA